MNVQVKMWLTESFLWKQPPTTAGSCTVHSCEEDGTGRHIYDFRYCGEEPWHRRAWRVIVEVSCTRGPDQIHQSLLYAQVLIDNEALNLRGR
jgi:hypothetical protein